MFQYILGIVRHKVIKNTELPHYLISISIFLLLSVNIYFVLVWHMLPKVDDFCFFRRSSCLISLGTYYKIPVFIFKKCLDNLPNFLTL